MTTYAFSTINLLRWLQDNLNNIFKTFSRGPDGPKDEDEADKPRHGSVTSDYIKLLDEYAEPVAEEKLEALAGLMGPADNPNSDIPAGYTYFGQFISHDITFSQAEGHNARSPILDLDSMYGAGPSDDSCLYRKTNGDSYLFITGNANNRHGDLYRDCYGRALIPDHRNDDNIVIASLHLLLQKFHNRLVTDKGLSFEKAKQTVIWHYQSAVLNDFLVKIVGQKMVEQILNGGRALYLPEKVGRIFIPTEFAGACFRFGHSMVRERYSFNETFDDVNARPNLFFGFPGGRPTPQGHQITEIWSLQGNGNSLRRFFATDMWAANDVDNSSGKIDSKLPFVLFKLPVPTRENNVLASRNLKKGQALQLASGQQLAKFMLEKRIDVTPLKACQIALPRMPEEFIDNTPLWFYVLREAEIQEDGRRLGKLGGRIVAETLVGLLQLDKGSYLNNREWPFTIPGVEGKSVSMLNIIDFVDAPQYYAKRELY